MKKRMQNKNLHVHIYKFNTVGKTGSVSCCKYKLPNCWYLCFCMVWRQEKHHIFIRVQFLFFFLELVLIFDRSYAFAAKFTQYIKLLWIIFLILIKNCNKCTSIDSELFPFTHKWQEPVKIFSPRFDHRKSHIRKLSHKYLVDGFSNPSAHESRKHFLLILRYTC